MKDAKHHRRTITSRENLIFSRKTGLLLSLVLLTLLIPAATRIAHGTGGVLYVSPTPVPQKPPGSIFTVQVKVSGVSSFDGWDISVQSDPAIIKPINLSLTGNLLTANYSETPNVLTSCINGLSTLPSGSCEPADGLGVVTSTIFVIGPPLNPPPNGLLFTITYNVTGTGSFSPIHFLNDQLSSQGNLVSHSTLDGAYGSGPGFNLGANPTSLAIRQGLNDTATLTVSSINGFAGVVSLSAIGGLTTSFGQATLFVSATMPKSTTLTFQTTKSTPATDYPTIITGSSSGLSVSTLVNVVVKTQPYFILNSSPSLLALHEGTSGNSVITVQSVVGFSGKVNLTVAAPQGVQTVLNTTTLTIAAGTQAEAALTVSVPLSHLAFKYLINVTATSSSYSAPTSEIIVQPPTPSFSTDVGSGSMTVEAGHSAEATLVVSSVDYLFGFVYISAQMSGGAATLSTGRLFLLPSGTANSTITIVIGADTVPGHYLLLLTIYQVGGPTRSVPVTIIVSEVLHSRPLSSTNLILGLPPAVYFGILGVLAVILGALSVQTYRKSREE